MAYDPMAGLRNNFLGNYNYNQGGGILSGSGVTTTLVNAPVASTAAPQEFQPNWLQRMGGYTDSNGIKSNGWGGMALGAVSGLGSAYLGMKQYGMAKKQLSESKRQFDLNYGAQRQMVNTDLEDRQRARVASNPTAYESVGSYMDRNKVR